MMQTIKRIGQTLLLSFGVFGVGCAIAALIASRSGRTLQDVLFVEGIVVAALGLMMSMKGNPSGTSLQGLGQQNANQVSNWHMETIQVEREKTEYGRNFLKHAVLAFSMVSIAILLGGVFLILFGILGA